MPASESPTTAEPPSPAGLPGRSAQASAPVPHANRPTRSGPDGALDANAASPLHFTGQRQDDETGLIHFAARNYTAAWGRWMSPDWAASPAAVPYSSLSNPQTLDLYAYALGNPATIDWRGPLRGYAARPTCALAGPGTPFRPSPTSASRGPRRFHGRGRAGPRNSAALRADFARRASGATPATNADPDGHWCVLGRFGTTCPPKQPAKSADPAHPNDQLSFQEAEWAANLSATRTAQAQLGTLGLAEVEAHPKIAFGALQALTLASAIFDDGASAEALPEEEALEAEAEGEASAAGGGQGVAAEGGPKYSARVGARAAGEPGPYHNFPRSFDADVIRSGEAREEAGGYTEYTLRGTINGKSGAYEIGVKNGEIVHRFFRPDQP